MTTPEQRTRAVIEARRLLLELISNGQTETLRVAAREAMRHYPGVIELSEAGECAPQVFCADAAWKGCHAGECVK